MQSNVTVPVSGSKFKLWLLIVVLAAAIFGGSAYGYYSWYKTNEPPPSLEPVDGSGLQGLMKIQDGDLTGYRKIEEADAPNACVGTSVEIGKGTNYLYATSTTAFKDFYDAIAVEENVDRTFLFLFYSPGETVDKTVYKKVETNKDGFYFYPTDETKYKATHIGLDSGKDYSIPSYRSVVLYNDEKMKICGDKIKVALGKEPTAGEESSLIASLSPFPKGWVLVPFGWNMEYVGFFGTELGDYVTSAWVQSGSEAIKVKDTNLGKIEAAIGASGTRSMWLKTKDTLDLPAIIAAQNQGGGGTTGDQPVSKNECTADFKCVRAEKSCFKLPGGDQICDLPDENALCERIKCGEGTVCEVEPAVLGATEGKIVAPAEVKCTPLVPKGAVSCAKQSDCAEGSSCIAHSADIFICKTKEQVDAVCSAGMVASVNVPNGGGPAVIICSPEVTAEEPECGVGKACSGEGAVCYQVPVEGGGNTFDCLTRDHDPCEEHPAPAGMKCSVNNLPTPKVVSWSEIPLFDQMLSTESGIMTHGEDFYGVYGKSLWKALFDGEQLMAYKDLLVAYGAGAEDFFSPGETDDGVGVSVVAGYNGYNVVATDGVMVGDIYSMVKPFTSDGTSHYLAVLYNSNGNVFVWPGAFASAMNLPFVKPASDTEILPLGSTFVLYSSKATELYGANKFAGTPSDQAMVFYYLSGPGKVINFVEGENLFEADKDLKLSDVLGLLEMNVTNLGTDLGIAFVYGDRGGDSVSVYPPKLANYFNGLVKIEDPSTFNISSGSAFSIFSTGAIQIPPSGFSVASLD